MRFSAAASVLMVLSTAACIESVKDTYKSDVDRTFLMAQTPERQVAAVGPPRYRDYVAMGGTSSWYTGLAGEQSTSASGLEVQDGVALTSGLDIVPAFAWAKLDHYSPDPTLREQSMRFTFGFHWRPFATDTRPPAVSLENLYVIGDLGYARLDRGMGSTTDEVTSGFVAARALAGPGVRRAASDSAPRSATTRCSSRTMTSRRTTSPPRCSSISIGLPADYCQRQSAWLDTSHGVPSGVVATA